ncbi:hypothetical protein BM1_04786 [Bipolaris maydis]|nr:hypothetical protein BM1_04786 [Bipolaris maydis]
MTYIMSGVYCMVLEWILLVLVYAFIAVRIYMRQFRFRENLDMAGYLLIVSALNALALVTWDTIAYKTGVLNGKVRSELLSKTYYEILLLTITDPVCMFALYGSLVTTEGRRTMRSTLLVTSLFVAGRRVLT